MKKLMSAIALLLVSGQGVAQNGYWEYREVCDYETKEVLTPYTMCFYRGPATVFIHNKFQVRYLELTTKFDDHITCKPQETTSSWITEYDHGNKEWDTALASASIPLQGWQHKSDKKIITTKITDSCRTEKVWIPLCDNCQIP